MLQRGKIHCYRKTSDFYNVLNMQELHRISIIISYQCSSNLESRTVARLKKHFSYVVYFLRVYISTLINIIEISPINCAHLRTNNELFITTIKIFKYNNTVTNNSIDKLRLVE